MVKAVIGEETQLKQAEDRLSQASVSSQIGLVIGKLSNTLDRGFVYDLIPTPLNDAGEPACSIIDAVDKKKGSKTKLSQADTSSLFIDKDWVAEHARQVSKMLLGGMKVIGIYVWLSENLFKNSTLILCQTVKAVSEAAPIESNLDERLLIHISYSPRRWTCKNCSLATNITSSSLKPCDFKMGKVLTSLQTFKCMYNVDLRLPIIRENESNSKKLSEILRFGISNHAKELKEAKALIDGKLMINDEHLLSDNLHEVEFLLPFFEDKYLEAYSNKEVIGVLTLSGSICSFAYLNTKESISQALSDIKEDIITSLQSRLDIMCDEADEEVDTAIKPVSELVLQFQREPCNLSFPRRVFVPWLGNIKICDYIQSSETLEVVKDHCIELMSMENLPDVLTMSEPESEALIFTSDKSFWDVITPLSSLEKNVLISGPVIEKKGTKGVDNSIIVAVLVLFVSVLLGLLLYVLKAS